MPRAFVQHPHPLPHGQPDARPVLAGSLEDAARFFEAVAGVEHELDPQPVAAPLLDLVEVAAVGIERVVGFLVGPVTHLARASPFRLLSLAMLGRNASTPRRASAFWTLLKHAGALQYRQPDARPVLDRLWQRSRAPCRGYCRHTEGHPNLSHAVPRPLFNLVEVADIRNQRVVWFLRRTSRSSACSRGTTNCGAACRPAARSCKKLEGSRNFARAENVNVQGWSQR